MARAQGGNDKVFCAYALTELSHDMIYVLHIPSAYTSYLLYVRSLAGHTYLASARRGRAQGKGGGGKIRMVYLYRFLCVNAGMLAAHIKVTSGIDTG